ncbi:hypothetical protein [Primorskyibacter sedentarius]|uniref:hypothetical protein n=1 Tax=Primorskyibacter sedentarius TaxID=745311 RepID=UPI003EBC803B
MLIAMKSKIKMEMIGVLGWTLIAALWVWALANAALVFVFEAPTAVFDPWLFLIAIVATLLWSYSPRLLGGDT